MQTNKTFIRGISSHLLRLSEDEKDILALTLAFEEEFGNDEDAIRQELFDKHNVFYKEDGSFIHSNIYSIFKEKRDQAILDEELTHVNDASDLHFITFLNSQPKLKTPAFFVNSFNNIELTWRIKKLGTVDIQFLEDGLLQYVLFSEEKDPDYGRDTVANVIEKIKDYGLWDLVYEPA